MIAYWAADRYVVGVVAWILQLLKSPKGARRSGDLLGAYDAAIAGIAAGDASHELCYLLVLTLARMGDTDRAHALFVHHNLASEASEDVQSLLARILKNRAIAAGSANRREMLRAASHAYLDANALLDGVTGRRYSAL